MNALSVTFRSAHRVKDYIHLFPNQKKTKQTIFWDGGVVWVDGKPESMKIIMLMCGCNDSNQTVKTKRITWII